MRLIVNNLKEINNMCLRKFSDDVTNTRKKVENAVNAVSLTIRTTEDIFMLFYVLN